MKRKLLCLVFLLLAVIPFSFADNLNKKVEFRAAWIATVANIDWPLAGSFDPDSQQTHMIMLLDSKNLISTLSSSKFVPLQMLFTKVIWSLGPDF